MTNKTQNSDNSIESNGQKATPLQCLIGSFLSGSLAMAMYFITYSIAHTFATKPVTSTNQLVIRISAAVRTLVVGVASLGTFIFGFVALGLVLLAIQLFIQSLKEKSTSSSNS
ncbi:DUF3082 domain-containing protein [Candidatus Gracilibacteria bacterium]|jgi:Protein of unknown function (DUF3082)|nr:DUF3082 domain-containing protein [Candidatus Gracilibacteria bacterium]NJP18425.1 DUF3082 domain-containing protein [Hydrococcus sp. CRU_1_1]NJQ98792.1 DUF3082 domain-containing protein [Hydrococcus sp. CSU_1_8]